MVYLLNCKLQNLSLIWMAKLCKLDKLTLLACELWQLFLKLPVILFNSQVFRVGKQPSTKILRLHH